MPVEAEHVGRCDRPYGWRAKLGLIVPPTNTINEAEWQAAVPDGVTIHTARMPLHLDTGSPEGRARLDADLLTASRDLAAAEVDVIAYGCTAGSLIQPIDALAQQVVTAIGTPAVSTAQAVVLALRHLGATRVAVATPYDDRLNTHERDFLVSCGFEVVAIHGMGFGASGPHEYRGIARLPSAEVEAFVLACDCPTADAVFVSCTDLATRHIHAALEGSLRKPVVGSNQATLWASLTAASTVSTDVDWGTLFLASVEAKRSEISIG